MPLRTHFLGIHRPIHKACLLSGDLSLIFAAFYFASNARLGTAPNFLSIEYIGISLLVIGCLFLGGAYTSSRVGLRPKLPLNTFFLVAASSIPTIFFIYILGPERFTALLGRGVYPIALFLFGILAVANHFALNLIFYQAPKKGAVVVLGERPSDQLVQLLESQSFALKLLCVPNLSSVNSKNQTLNAVVITPEYLPSDKEQAALLNYRLRGVAIYSLSDFFEHYFYLVPVQEINNDWFIRSHGFSMLHNSAALRFKRLLDIVSSIALMLLSLPITLVAAILIKSTSRGPLIYSQTRVGLSGKKFVVYKFRTMKQDAEKTGVQWSKEGDDRITWVGKILRSTRIDELPQCWNILRGDMSIVGPRPERPEFTSLLSREIPYYDLRHIVKPGLTGWAQVNYPYGASTEDSLRKLQFDLYYIKNFSFLLDVNIILRTIRVALGRRGR